ncbi:MAG: cysteine hydrolase family protein [Ktedonobacterales bacterium]
MSASASTFTLDTQHTALLIMDYQTGIVSSVEARYPHLLNRAAAVLAAARAATVPVIYVVVRFRDGYPEVSPRNRAFSGIRASGRMLEGTPGAEIHPRVAPLPGEPVVVKRRVGAFSTTDLATLLRARDATTLVLLGIATSGVVLSTVRWAADMDYELVVVEDCCADGDDEVHRVLTQKVFPRQASVAQSGDVIGALRPADQARA